jgi:hypothetical protein
VPVLIPSLAGIIPIETDNIVRIDRACSLGPRLFLRDGRTAITTKEALAQMERARQLPAGV